MIDAYFPTTQLALSIAFVVCLHVEAQSVPCAVNKSAGEPPLTCPAGSECCRSRHWGVNICAEDSKCNVCAECCHDIYANATMCSACVAKSCAPGSFGDSGCRNNASMAHTTCCEGGRPLAPATDKPNCLLIGDSVTNGMFSNVASQMADICKVQHIESVDAYAEHECFWATGTSAIDGKPIHWDVIHYNEGLHSLWPRVNTTAELAQYAEQLGNFTEALKATGAKLIYATMTPFMPEKYLNPSYAQHDVEDKNALAVKTVNALGVTTINDLYSVITDKCGLVYRNCSICDDESAYHPQGECGYHYNAEGWELLANATATYLREALQL